MANGVYDTYAQGVQLGELDLDLATVKAVLVRSYTFSAAHKFVSDVTTAGGVLHGTPVALANKSVSVTGVFDADDVVYGTPAANATGHGVLVYQSSAVGGGADVAAAAQRVISWYDTGTNLPYTPDGVAAITITWDNGANKILKL